LCVCLEELNRFKSTLVVNLNVIITGPSCRNVVCNAQKPGSRDERFRGIIIALGRSARHILKQALGKAAHRKVDGLLRDRWKAEKLSLQKQSGSSTPLGPLNINSAEHQVAFCERQANSPNKYLQLDYKGSLAATVAGVDYPITASWAYKLGIVNISDTLPKLNKYNQTCCHGVPQDGPCAESVCSVYLVFCAFSNLPGPNYVCGSSRTLLGCYRPNHSQEMWVKESQSEQDGECTELGDPMPCLFRNNRRPFVDHRDQKKWQTQGTQAEFCYPTDPQIYPWQKGPGVKCDPRKNKYSKDGTCKCRLTPNGEGTQGPRYVCQMIPQNEHTRVAFDENGKKFWSAQRENSFHSKEGQEFSYEVDFPTTCLGPEGNCNPSGHGFERCRRQGKSCQSSEHATWNQCKAKCEAMFGCVAAGWAESNGNCKKGSSTCKGECKLFTQVKGPAKIPFTNEYTCPHQFKQVSATPNYRGGTYGVVPRKGYKCQTYKMTRSKEAIKQGANTWLPQSKCIGQVKYYLT